MYNDLRFRDDRWYIYGWSSKQRNTTLSGHRCLPACALYICVCIGFVILPFIDWSKRYQYLAQSPSISVLGFHEPTGTDLARTTKRSGDYRATTVESGYCRGRTIRILCPFFLGGTVLAKFRTQLNALLTDIQATNVHYIRCMKPNTVQSSHEFDLPLVLRQLQSAGLVEAIQMARAAFPNKYIFQSLIRSLYRTIYPSLYITRSFDLSICLYICIKNLSIYLSIDVKIHMFHMSVNLASPIFPFADRPTQNRKYIVSWNYIDKNQVNHKHSLQCPCMHVIGLDASVGRGWIHRTRYIYIYIMIETWDRFASRFAL